MYKGRVLWEEFLVRLYFLGCIVHELLLTINSACICGFISGLSIGLFDLFVYPNTKTHLLDCTFIEDNEGRQSKSSNFVRFYELCWLFCSLKSNVYFDISVSTLKTYARILIGIIMFRHFILKVTEVFPHFFSDLKLI